MINTARSTAKLRNRGRLKIRMVGASPSLSAHKPNTSGLNE
jgi:hypothetical protein